MLARLLKVCNRSVFACAGTMDWHLPRIGDLSEMRQVLGILAACGIDYEWSDIAQQIYQG